MTPDTIIIHCSATRESQAVTVEQIDEMHRLRGFFRPLQAEKLKHIGYHYYIRRDGIVYPGRLETEQGAHCAGYNSRSIGVCYEGGLDAAGRPKDTRTEAQKIAIRNLVAILCRKWTVTEILGHRDTSPDKNANGTVEPSEWTKACPCFDAKTEYKSYLNKI
jgi:N-acetyl-anhydromuramyl-L-alanine amidase AmpD